MHNASEADKYRMLKEDQAHVLTSKVFKNLENDVYEVRRSVQVPPQYDLSPL